MAKILHVDDQSSWRDSVVMIFGAKGHTVVSCSTMAAVKAAYHPAEFDLVLCDGTVDSDGDGVAWAEELYNDGQKTVILSGDAQSHVPVLSKGKVEPAQLLALLDKS